MPVILDNGLDNDAVIVDTGCDHDHDAVDDYDAAGDAGDDGDGRGGAREQPKHQHDDVAFQS